MLCSLEQALTLAKVSLDFNFAWEAIHSFYAAPFEVTKCGDMRSSKVPQVRRDSKQWLMHGGRIVGYRARLNYLGVIDNERSRMLYGNHKLMFSLSFFFSSLCELCDFFIPY
jgi:hypothetical protein